MNPFGKVALNRPGRTAFDLSHERKFSSQFANLTPILVQEVVPGDRFKNYGTEAIVRLAPMVAPIMHRINVFAHYFFVPNRLVYQDWETFITGGEDGQQIPSFPKINLSETNKASFAPGSLADFMGAPTWVTGEPTITRDINISALPFRAYQLIWNEYYRDQNLMPKLAITKNGTVDATEQAILLTMRKRCWERDYFTSALPWPQRGADVEMPTDVNYKTTDWLKKQDGSTYPGAGEPVTVSTGQLTASLSGTNTPMMVENIDSLGTTINDLRKAVRLQEWLERNARAGSRYIEQILSHFGVKSSDARLQRPEFLGGGKSPVVISEVLATYGTDATIPVGNMAGHGLSAGSLGTFDRTFEEHGYIIGIMSVLPRTAYSQGVDKQLIKFDKFDYYWPEFAQLGEQPIQNQEVFKAWNVPNEDQTFGYTPRYSEYKFKQSTVHGEFKNTLDFWHMGRKFAAAPALNSQFVTCDATTRIFADESATDKLYIQLYNHLRAVRPMPGYNVPTL